MVRLRLEHIDEKEVAVIVAPTERGRKDGFSPRELALRTLYQVESEGAYANLALNRALQHSGFKKLDRGFVTEQIGRASCRERV